MQEQGEKATAITEDKLCNSVSFQLGDSHADIAIYEEVYHSPIPTKGSQERACVSPNYFQAAAIVMAALNCCQEMTVLHACI